MTDECFDSFVAAANGAEWDRLALGRSDGRRLLPEARFDEAAPHRGLVEELHVAVRPARQDGKVAVVPLVVDAVEIGVQELLLDLQLGASGFLVLTTSILTFRRLTRPARARDLRRVDPLVRRVSAGKRAS